MKGKIVLISAILALLSGCASQQRGDTNTVPVNEQRAVAAAPEKPDQSRPGAKASGKRSLADRMASTAAVELDKNRDGRIDDDLLPAALTRDTELAAVAESKQNALGFTPENAASKGLANGYAGLGADGKVPTAQLPAGLGGGVTSYTELSDLPTIPDELADLATDTANQRVSATEKSTWNAKQNALTAGTDYLTPTGSAAGLTGWPTLNQNTTGSAAKLATARTIGGVSFDGSANIDLPGVNAAGTQNTTGNAATATTLQTARTIAGTSFNGSASIDISYVNLLGLPILGTAAGLDHGTAIGDVMRFIDAGTCSNPSYTNESTCESNSGTWTAALGLPFTLPSKADASCFASESAFNACFNLTWAGVAINLDGLSDVVISGPPTTNYVLKFNGTNWVPAADATAEGAGYVSTPPIYSDEPCTAGQYANSTSPLRLYSCLGDRWVYIDSTGLVEWDNLTPVTRTLTVTAPSNGTITCLDSDLSAAINCGTGGSTCTATTADGVSITGITATADSGYALSAWSGDLSGATTPTTLTMSTDRGIGATFGASGPTVSLYFNADSDTDQQTPSKGSGLIGVAANVTSVPGQVGNAVQGAGGWAGVNIPTSGNLSTSTGTLAFYVHRGTDTGNQIVSLDGVSYAQFSITYQAGNTYRFLYLGTVVGTVDFAANTTYFVEMSWDQPNAAASYRINGGSWTSSAVSGTAPTSAGLVLITSDGTGFNGWFDQVLISPDYQADLYSVRTNTSF